jgi:hypothetical protein
MRKKSLSTPLIFTCKPRGYCYKHLRDFLSNSKYSCFATANPVAVLTT